jgi:hypothetical protein
MSIITSNVEILRRYFSSPLNVQRFHPVYRWNNASYTEDQEYKDIPVYWFDVDDIDHQEGKPSLEYIEEFAQIQDYEGKYYYACEFQMSDFSLTGKVSTDMAADEKGDNYFITLENSKFWASCKNPLEYEDAMYIVRNEDGTMHLNTGFEVLAELQERGYNGKIWAIVEDFCN